MICLYALGLSQNQLNVHFTSKKPEPEVLIFIRHDCPISNGYAPEINRIYARFKSHFNFHLVFEESISHSAAQKHLTQYNLGLPFLIDSSQHLANSWRISVTPEVAVISSQNKLLYEGRIDDSYLTLGTRRVAVNQHDLIDALQQCVQGKAISETKSPAIGCILNKPVVSK